LPSTENGQRKHTDSSNSTENIDANVPLEDDLKDFLHIIAPYYFTARYPDVAMGLPEGAVTKNFALESLEKTRRIFECFDKKLPKA
jgi:HEPN domain-containing protein